MKEKPKRFITVQQVNNKLKAMRLTFLIILFIPAIALSQVDHKVSIYPNPATDVITVKMGEREDIAMVKIINQGGNVVWSEHRDEAEFKLNLEHYPPGVYHVQISVLDKVELYKFIKK